MAKDKSQQHIDNENRKAKQERVLRSMNSIIFAGGFADFEYIQKKYQVPAYRGVHVKSDIFPGEEGIITGADGSYLVVRFEGDPITRILHPTDVEYLGVAFVKREDQEGEA
jgi:hypothetical protein